MTPSIRNQNGFTLMEMLVASSLGLFVLFTIFTIHSMMMRSQVTSMNSMDVVDLKYEVASLLAKNDKCTAILAGKPSVNGTAIVVSPTISSNVDWAGKRMHITSVQLKGVRSLGTASKVSAKVELKGTLRGANLMKSDFTEYVNIYYAVNGSNVIVTCEDDSAVCSNMGGTWRTDHCDFCTNLGGVVRADGTCAATL
jgi:prepilin-type N-terminal cleavage/methylation domain-containing protein